MKINVAQATVATLDIVVEMAAKQMAFHEIMLSYLTNYDDEKYLVIQKEMKRISDDKIDLLKTKVFQYAEVSHTDLLNGLFDF